MPTYEFKCLDCGKGFERFFGQLVAQFVISNKPQCKTVRTDSWVACEHCSSLHVEKLMSAPSTIIIKDSV